MKSKYAATEDSVGDWDGRETQIAEKWNNHILPILANRENNLNPESDDYEKKLNQLENSADSAWGEFCGSGGKIRAAKKLAGE